MSHLTSCISLKTEGLITGALPPSTQMNPNKNAFLSEKSKRGTDHKSHYITDITFLSQQRRSLQKNCYAEGIKRERPDCCSDFSETMGEFEWIQTKLFLKTSLLIIEILVA